jgi:DNA repair protein RecN (Recombination protein N)
MAEAETLRAAVDELVQANLQPNEFEELADKATRLTHLEELRIAAETAHEAISSQDSGLSSDVLGLLALAKRALEQVAQHDSKLQDFADSIASSSIVMRETATDLASYLASLESASAAELERVQQRRSEINGLIRKYGVDFESTLAYSDSASARLLELDSSTEEIDRLVGETAACFESMSVQAMALTKMRQAAAKQLEAEVSVELQALAMPGASLVVSVTEANEFSTFGKDSVSIQLSSYPGADPRPLGKGASGGELSRIMLSIEVVLAKTEVVPTFIFDEVDAGVGGAAAIEIGRRLAQLAEQAQVIVVTHLAQVAAFANHHLRVLKKSTDEYTSSDVVTLGFDERVSELARMLSGLSESESALEHARELISLAHTK